ncbi:MAG: hypothetical protein QXN53_08130 [Thermoproteota archaeon]
MKISKIFSAGELIVYDSWGRVTGVINGQIKEEIPESIYDNESKSVIIFNSTDIYCYEVVGINNGSYGLIMISLKPEGGVYFTAADIPISLNETHKYFVNWVNCSLITNNPSARFKLSYSLRVILSYGNVSGEGWYEANSTAYFTISPTLLDYGNATRVVFVGWHGDIITEASSASIVMDSPKVVRESWKRQYYIRIKSEYGNPIGEGWYNEGATATISIEVSVPAKDFLGLFGAKCIFDGWSGDIISTSPLMNIQVDSPKEIRVNWKYDYTMPFSLLILIGVIGFLILFVVLRRLHS